MYINIFKLYFIKIRGDYMELKEISLEIIRKCPNNCVHCSSNSSMNCTEMISFDNFISIVDDALELGLKTLCFSGGEPFIHPEFTKMIEYVALKKIDTFVYTSGIYMNDGEISSIPVAILRCIKDKISKLIFNVEAACENTYNSIMGTKDCFKYLRKSVYDANMLSIITEANFVPMRLNVDEVEATIQMCQKLGMSKINFLRLVNHGRAEFNELKVALTDDEIENIKAYLKEICLKNNDINIRIGIPLSGHDCKHKCEAARGKLNIKYDGSVYPCEVFKNNKVQILSKRKADNIYLKSLKDIYLNSEYLCEVRNYVEVFSHEHECENCVGQYYIKNI